MRVIELIKRITGREVLMVPPTAYFVSAPPPRVAPPKPVEVVVAADIPSKADDEGGPLVLDVSAVMREGGSDRMILGSNDDGNLALFRGVNLEL